MTGSSPQAAVLSGSAHLVLYDGVCGLCNRLLQFLLARDQRAVFSFAPLQSEAGKAVVTSAGGDPSDLTSFYVLANFRSSHALVLAKGDAALFVAGELGWPWKVFTLAALLPRVVRNRVYDFVARNRYHLFGRVEHCLLPSREFSGRFVESLDAIPPCEEVPDRRNTIAPWRGWLPILLLPVAVIAGVPAAVPSWAAMWTLAFAIYAGCKWLTWRRTPATNVSAWRHIAYLCAWPGLDAAAFLSGEASPPCSREWMAGIRNSVVGLLLFFGAARIVFPHHPGIAAWIGMTGAALALHSGLFALLSCGWRRFGIDARPIMNQPLRSDSVGEFWGRRWNTAFRDLTHRFLFRPLTQRLGTPAALVGGFVFSGLVHDLVISWPAAGGWGGPTIFFAIQAGGVLLERTRPGRALNLGRGLRGKLFTMATVLLSAPLLFHPPFVERVVIPFMQAMRAL